MEIGRQTAYFRSMPKFIYHMCEKEAWEEAIAKGQYDGSKLDLHDGFIHFSTADKLIDTASTHLSGVEGLVLLIVPTDNVADALKWEKSREGKTFPHLYRPLRPTEVERVSDLKLDAGRHIFPELA